MINKKKLFYTLLIISVYILGNNIELPILKTNNMDSSLNILFNDKKIYIFSLGITPWMSSMILWKVITTLKIFRFNELSTKDSNIRQNILTLIVSLIQAVVLTRSLDFKGYNYNEVVLRIICIIILIAGTFMVVWISNMNSEYGMGGIIMIMLINFILMYIRLFKDKPYLDGGFLNKDIIYFLVFFSIFSLIFTIFLELSEYRIPIIKTLLNNKFNKDTYIPIKLNSSGGMAFMYAMPLMTLPVYILGMFTSIFPNSEILAWWISNLQFNKLPGIILYNILLFILSFSFTFINIDIENTTKNLRVSGDFIEGITPGFLTEKYLFNRVALIAIIVSFYIFIISFFPLIFLLKYENAIQLFMIPGIIMMTAAIVISIGKEFEILQITRKYKKDLF